VSQAVLEARQRLCVACDVPDLAAFAQLADALAPVGCVLKIGKELFTACGPEAVRLAADRGLSVFLDLKYCDIPNTVAGAVAAAARLGVEMLTVHTSGGPAMLAAAVEASRRAGAGAGRRPRILGVTVLTSLDASDLAAVGDLADVAGLVRLRAALAERCGCDGVIAAAADIAAVRATAPSLEIVVPGIRPADHAAERAPHDDEAARRAAPSAAVGVWGAAGGAAERAPHDDDQKRTATPAAAIRAGATRLVVGRPILRAADPAAAAAGLVAEIAACGPGAP